MGWGGPAEKPGEINAAQLPETFSRARAAGPERAGGAKVGPSRPRGGGARIDEASLSETGFPQEMGIRAIRSPSSRLPPARRIKPRNFSRYLAGRTQTFCGCERGRRAEVHGPRAQPPVPTAEPVTRSPASSTAEGNVTRAGQPSRDGHPRRRGRDGDVPPGGRAGRGTGTSWREASRETAAGEKESWNQGTVWVGRDL